MNLTVRVGTVENPLKGHEGAMYAVQYITTPGHRVHITHAVPLDGYHRPRDEDELLCALWSAMWDDQAEQTRQRGLRFDGYLKDGMIAIEAPDGK